MTQAKFGHLTRTRRIGKIIEMDKVNWLMIGLDHLERVEANIF